MHLEEKIIKKCESQNIAFEILFTSKDGDYQFLPGKIIKETISDIAICGGDGSIAPIISSILNNNVRIGIIPLGSGNGLAQTAGIPKSIDKALEVIFNGKANATDAFLISGKFSVHVSGLGFDAKVAHDFSRSNKRGLQSYTRIALKNFFSAKTYPFTLYAEGQKIKLEAFLICIANSNQFGNNFKIAPQASIGDGLLDIVVLKRTSKPSIVLSFIKQIISGKIKRITGANVDQQNILYFQTKKLRIENPALAPLHIDGDPAETYDQISVEILPSAYQLIQP